MTRPVNVLVLGIDNSGHPHEKNFTPAEAMAGNSDTMLLVRLIPDTHQINILSIPRDTLIHISGVGVEKTYGIDKINDSNVRRGVALAKKDVSHLLSDIPIDRYVRLDTEGFIHLADALGGVEVNIPKPMYYVDRSQNLNINLQAGRQKLNGQHLQEYVRFRHDNLADIGRVQRQQEVMKGMLRALVQPSTIGRLPQLLQVVRDNVDTDLSTGEMLAIAQLLSATSHQNMNVLMLPGRFSRRDEYRLSYWIEDTNKAATILAQYFDVRSSKVNAVADTPSSIKSIRVAVANATGINSQASNTARFLKKRGFDNTYITTHEIDSASIPLSETQIIAQQGNLQAANAIKSTIGLGQVQVASTGDMESDVTVVVGTDLAKKLKQLK